MTSSSGDHSLERLVFDPFGWLGNYWQRRAVLIRAIIRRANAATAPHGSGTAAWSCGGAGASLRAAEAAGSCLRELRCSALPELRGLRVGEGHGALTVLQSCWSRAIGITVGWSCTDLLPLRVACYGVNSSL